MGFFKLFFMGKDKGKLLAKIKKTIKKVGSVVADAPLLPILPFILVMKKMLKDRGLPLGENNRDLVKSFYENIVKKHKSFDDQRENLVEDIVSIVKDIIGFFAKAKGKTDKGQGSPEEKEAVKLATKVIETPTTDKEEKSGMTNKIPGGKNTLFIVGGLAVGAVLFTVLKKK